MIPEIWDKICGIKEVRLIPHSHRRVGAVDRQEAVADRQEVVADRQEAAVHLAWI
jgi:hypothetical protein